MNPFSLEHGKAAYFADFVAYAVIVAALAALLAVSSPKGEGFSLIALAAAGLAGWTLAEYLLHRFVLHGLAPFRNWHTLHHRRPTALISTPTLLSAGLIVALVAAPAAFLGGRWDACALTVGVSGGYLAYAITHHATHHGRARGRWLRRRKYWHARHHHLGTPAGCYGVTGEFWDRVFGTVVHTTRPARPA